MVKKSRPKLNKNIVIFAVAVLAVGGVTLGLLLWQNSRTDAGALDSPRSEKACHTVPTEVTGIGTYHAPCVVTVTMMQYGQTVDEAGERARLQAAIAPFDATISPTSLPDIGVYYLDVAPGTEDKIITHLQAQEGITSASREMSCVHACIGAN